MFAQQKHNKVRYSPRAHYDRETILPILDTGLVAHVGFVLGDLPMVIPMAYARIEDTLYIHGAKAARIIKKPEERARVCLTVTHIDGIVAARSAFHHSMNYRSVVVHGWLRRITDAAEKEAALVAVTDHILPGRWDEVRPMTEKEFKSTGVLAVDIETASAKIRKGPPVDEDEDYELPVWAGVLPTPTIVTEPVEDPKLPSGIERPASLKAAEEKFSAGLG